MVHSFLRHGVPRETPAKSIASFKAVVALFCGVSRLAFGKGLSDPKKRAWFKVLDPHPPRILGRSLDSFLSSYGIDGIANSFRQCGSLPRLASSFPAIRESALGELAGCWDLSRDFLKEDVPQHLGGGPSFSILNRPGS